MASCTPDPEATQAASASPDPIRSRTQPLLVDLSSALEQLRQQLRAELLAQLREELANTAWPRWMNIETVARYTDVSPERIRKLVARHEIPLVQEAPGCRIFFDRNAIDEWLTTFTQPLRSRP